MDYYLSMDEFSERQNVRLSAMYLSLCERIPAGASGSGVCCSKLTTDVGRIARDERKRLR